jgi:hypothetical protein
MKLNHPLYLLHFFFKYHFLSLYPRFSVNREEMMPGKTKFIKKDISLLVKLFQFFGRKKQ